MHHANQENEHASVTEIILDSIADGVFTVDRDWRITEFNRAAEAITGIPRQQAVGQKCFDVFRADICQQACALRQTIQTGQTIVDQKVNILNSHGQTIPVSISTAVLRNKNNDVIGGVETFRDLSAIELLRKEISASYHVADIVSKNHQMQRILQSLPDVAQSDSTVLIHGATGTGKELLAKALHTLSNRHNGPFVPINCSALPETLLESELFGYVKGAFTGAEHDKPGRFQNAAGGTLFLDEIGDISIAMQVKLLRVIQERQYEPLGSNQPRTADVRILAATHRDLKQMIAQQTFREDLYYRLSVVRLHLPLLRERREDIPLLVNHFIEKLNAERGTNIAGLTDDAMAALLDYPFPGNIRELENFIEHGAVLSNSHRIALHHLPPELRQTSTPSQNQSIPQPTPPQPQIYLTETTTPKTLEQLEKEAIIHAIQHHPNSRHQAAAELGIHPTTLWRKLKRHNITPTTT